MEFTYLGSWWDGSELTLPDDVTKVSDTWAQNRSG